MSAIFLPRKTSIGCRLRFGSVRVTPRRDPYFVVTVRELNLRSPMKGYPVEYSGESNPLDRDVIVPMPKPLPAAGDAVATGAAAGSAFTTKGVRRPVDRSDGDAIKSNNKITRGRRDGRTACLAS